MLVAIGLMRSSDLILNQQMQCIAYNARVVLEGEIYMSIRD